MSLAESLRSRSVPTAGGGRRLGTVARLEVDGGHTRVTVLDGHGGGSAVTLAHRPDARAAEGVTGGYRHVSWVRIALHDDGPRAAVHGQRHRLPVTAAIPVDAALGLARAGVPTLVTTGGPA